jgi:hypothetical protein
MLGNGPQIWWLPANAIPSPPSWGFDHRTTNIKVVLNKYIQYNPLCWPRDALYQQKLALTLATSGGLSVSIVSLRTKATEFIYYMCCPYHSSTLYTSTHLPRTFAFLTIFQKASVLPTSILPIVAYQIRIMIRQFSFNSIRPTEYIDYLNSSLYLTTP